MQIGSNLAPVHFRGRKSSADFFRWNLGDFKFSFDIQAPVTLRHTTADQQLGIARIGLPATLGKIVNDLFDCFYVVTTRFQFSLELRRAVLATAQRP